MRRIINNLQFTDFYFTQQSVNIAKRTFQLFVYIETGFFLEIRNEMRLTEKHFLL